MSPDRWLRVEEIFHAVAELPAAERATYLDRECAADAELRAEVESLLEADTTESSLVKSVIENEAEHLATERNQSVIGQHIGPYRVIREIGQGGMGTVYLAVRDDQQFEKEVALKLVRLGMDTEFLVKRFRQERQILAHLEHPNIARLLEGGVSGDGRPYFAMEYVDGAPITKFCEDRRLPIDERLSLFRRVCRAVDYAHQKLIVHRDLKPSNILVTADGEPKLLDFGIAKLLSDHETSTSAKSMALTLTLMRMMTPDYASPEQVRGEPSSTATDVYSLGIVLYEMLTGKRPHQFRSYTPSEIERVICHEEPEKPSTMALRSEPASERDPERHRRELARELSGDLDNIVLMAIRPEPDQRYSSVEQLADDIQRYLEGMPVHARQGTLVYRAGKFVRRHRIGIAAGALAACTLIGGVIASAHEAATAQRRFEQVHKLANKFLFDFDDRIQMLTGSTSARELMVRTALQYLDSLKSESGDDPMLEWELAVAYERVGDVQGNPTMANLGQPGPALESYRKALELEQGLLRRDWLSLSRAALDRRRILRSLSMVHYKSGDLLEQKGATIEALQTFQKGLDIAQSLFAYEPREPEDHQLLGMGHHRIGDIALKQSKAEQARESFRHASEAFEQWAARQPDDRSRRFVAFSYNNLGRVLMDLGDVAGSLANYRRALAIREDLARRDPANAIYRRDLMGAYMSLGDTLGSPAYFNMGDPAGAIDAYNKGLALAERLAAEDARNVLARRDLTTALRKTANLQRASDPAGAADRYRQAMSITEDLLKLDPQNSEWRRMHALNELQFGYTLFKIGERAGANRLLQSALETQRSLSETDSTRTTYSQDLVTTYHFLGDLYLASNNDSRALENHELALKLSNDLVARSPADLYALFCLGDSYERLGRDHAAIARRRPGPPSKTALQAARGYYAQSLDAWTEWDRRGASNPFNLRRKNQLAAAIAECEKALAGLSR